VARDRALAAVEHLLHVDAVAGRVLAEIILDGSSIHAATSLFTGFPVARLLVLPWRAGESTA
jgi:hypothetical protein